MDIITHKSNMLVIFFLDELKLNGTKYHKIIENHLNPEMPNDIKFLMNSLRDTEISETKIENAYLRADDRLRNLNFKSPTTQIQYISFLDPDYPEEIKIKNAKTYPLMITGHGTREEIIEKAKNKIKKRYTFEYRV